MRFGGVLSPGPTWPTAEFPIWALKVPCRCLYRWTYTSVFGALWRQERNLINDWRSECLGQAPWPRGGRGSFDVLVDSEAPVLVAASQLLCGARRLTPDDYPAHVTLGGFAFPEATLSNGVESQLHSFVEGGAALVTSPIVYLGFGSMPAPDITVPLQLAVDVCRQLDCRCVLTAGWTALETDPGCAEILAAASGAVLAVASAPHDWLFPRCAALVHHCGVGTMAAALRSGTPQVPCPFMLDQPHNAKICVQLGVAPTWIPFSSISTARLSSALQQILNEGTEGPLHQAARQHAERVRVESEGVIDHFCEIIERARPQVSHPVAAHPGRLTARLITHRAD